MQLSTSILWRTALALIVIIGWGLVAYADDPSLSADIATEEQDLSLFEQTLSREMMSAGQTLDSAQDASALADWAVGRVGSHTSRLVRSQVSHLLPDQLSDNRYL